MSYNELANQRVGFPVPANLVHMIPFPFPMTKSKELRSFCHFQKVLQARIPTPESARLSASYLPYSRDRRFHLSNSVQVSVVFIDLSCCLLPPGHQVKSRHIRSDMTGRV